jgi:NAD(P)-dependent dehydrogenase (short-subunit alcohol dehydrogenase family)
MKSLTALVTGSSRGIGSGIAIELAKKGISVAITYVKNRVEAEHVCQKIKSMGVNSIAIQMNSDSRKSIKNAISLSKKELGRIDILVNNAAISQEKSFDSITDEDWNQMMAINLRGPFCLVQELLPDMIENQWGRIINISSVGGQWGGYNQVHYAATKAALINFTQSIAKIYSGYGITSNAIAPGLIDTDMISSELNTEVGKEKVANIPLKRLGTVKEIGSAVAYLVSDEASYITGQTININGGMFFST